MTKPLSSRAQKRLEAFAPYLGGKDAYGLMHYVSESDQREHVFAVKNVTLENSSWSFILGYQIEALIRDDLYEIDYIGKHSDFVSLKIPSQMIDEPGKKKFREKILALIETPKADVDEENDSTNDLQTFNADNLKPKPKMSLNDKTLIK